MNLLQFWKITKLTLVASQTYIDDNISAGAVDINDNTRVLGTIVQMATGV